MEEQFNQIIKLLQIIECRLQKIIKKHNEEQTECKSDCSKEKINIIVRKLETLKNIFKEIR